MNRDALWTIHGAARQGSERPPLKSGTACRLRAPGVWALAIVASLWTTACGDSEPAAPYLEPGGCDLAPYEWLPARDVGEPLDHEEDVLSPLQAQAIDAVLPDDYDFFSPVPNGARLFHVRYTTQDRGQAVEATGLLGIPIGDPPAGGRFPVVMWGHGTTGFTHACAPSAMGAEGTLLIYLLTSLGYVVVAPDYIGLDGDADTSEPPPVRHAYAGIEQTAIGALDMVRAARALLRAEPDLAVPVRSDLAVWGASQGGHAALATELLAPYYAPEEDVVAAVASVPPTDLMGLADYAIAGPSAATAAIAASLVTAHYWYEGSGSLVDLLSSEQPWDPAHRLADAMFSGCDAGDVVDGATAIDQIYNGDLLDQLAGSWQGAEPWSCYMTENSFATTSIPRISDTPTFIALAENDTLVYTPAIRDDIPRLCAQGYRIEVLECAGASHTEGAVWSLPEQRDWLDARLAGEPLDPATLCQVQPAVRCAGQP